jgi:hypothetical protein
VSRPAALASLSRGHVTVLGAVLLGMAYGCSRDPAVSAAAACRPPGGGFQTMSRTDLVTWANGLTYQPPNPASAYVYGFAPSDSVRIEGTDNRAGRACLLARVTSPRTYPALGIAAGRSYVWIDSLADGYRTFITAEDSTAAMRVVPLALHDHLPGAQPPPSVGAFGGCVAECGEGGKKWCRFAFDTSRTASLMRPLDRERPRAMGVRPS